MGAENITNKIIQDAKDEAAKHNKQSEQQAAEEAKNIAAEAENAAAKNIALAEKATAENERRLLLGASLTARKNTLAKKREVLDTAFGEALEELAALEGERYAALMVKLCVAASETGVEQLVVPAGHAVRYQKVYIGGKTMLEYLNAALKDAGKTGALTLGEPTEAFRAGFVLKGNIADIDCSVESLIANFRAERESEVAALLFESGV